MRLSGRNLSITSRMLVGYLVVVFLPVLALGIAMFNQIYENGMRNYAQNNHVLLEQMHGNFKSQLVQIEKIYELLQFNTNVVELISGYYQTENEQVYVYNKNISLLSSFIYLSYPIVEEVTIYTNHESVLELGSTILNMSRLDQTIITPDSLNIVEGRWVLQLDSNPVKVEYYRNLFNEDYSKVIGLMRVSVNSSMLFGLFQSGETLQGSSLVFLSEDSTPLLLHAEKQANVDDHALAKQPWPEGEAYYITKAGGVKRLIHRLYIEDFQVTEFVIIPVDDAFEIGWTTKITMALLVFFLLLVLSFIYYFIISSVTKRIIRFARHVRTISENNLTVFTKDNHNDEINVLVNSFNVMIQRMHTLINTVYKAELKEKEAKYAALQSQINPHFLYNSLETLRMMAMTNGDHEVADMSYTLGRLMRYGLENNPQTSLIEEIKHLESYLRIQKIRLGPRLDYEIHITTPIDSYSCPKFIIQPIVENAIIHGIAKLKRGGSIQVHVSQQGCFLEIIVRDNGVGMKPEEVAKLRRQLSHPSEDKLSSDGSSGIGVVNVNERLQHYYGADCGVQVESTFGEGATFTMKLKRVVHSECNGC